LWRVSDGQLLHDLSIHRGRVLSLAFSPDGTLLASGDASGDLFGLNLWSVQAGAYLNSFPAPGWPTAGLAFSPDGQTLVSAHQVWYEHEVAEIKLWRVSDYSLLRIYNQETGRGVESIASLPASAAFTYGRRDGTVVRAQNPYAQPPVGGVEGVVLVGGAPLANVTVNLSASGGHTDVTQTDANGAYSFEEVPPGPAQVSLELPAGYEPVQPPGGTATVQVTGGGTVTQDFVLAGFGEVAGVVLGDGVPLAGVTVNLTSGGGPPTSDVTESDGTYGFAHVPAGTAEVSVVAPPGYMVSSPIGGMATVIVTAGQTVGQDFALLGLGTISGVVSGDGAPLSNVTLNLSASGSHTGVTQTDANGAFLFQGIPAGPAQVSLGLPAGYESVQPPGGTATVQVTGGGTVTQNFTLAGFGAVSGVVLADGAPRSGVAVNFAANGGQQLSTVTTAAGAYEFTHVATGPASVSVAVPAGYEAGVPAGGTAGVAVVAGQTVTQNFTLIGFGDISGTVLVGGSPLANVTVDLVSSGGGIEFTATAVDGSYAFARVAAGAAEVSIVVPLGYLVVDPEAGTATVTVTAGEVAVRNFTLQQLADAGPARTIGYWKHQVNVYVSGRGTAQESFTVMSDTYPTRIFEHFFSNQLNSIDVEDVTFLPGPVRMTLASMHSTLNLRNASILERAKQQYLALLLNVASNRLQSATVVSADGATASQAIQQIASQIKDGVLSNDEQAKDVADAINNGVEVAAGIINTSIPQIPFAPRPFQAAMARVSPNPLAGTSFFDFDVLESGWVDVSVYDTTGRRVRTLIARNVPRGRQRIGWDGRLEGGRSVANGVYFYRIAMPDRVLTSRFVVMR